MDAGLVKANACALRDAGVRNLVTQLGGDNPRASTARDSDTPQNVALAPRELKAAAQEVVAAG